MVETPLEVKHIQIIDGALNSTLDIYEVPDELFEIMFLGGADVAFLDEVEERFKAAGVQDPWPSVYKTKVDKKKVVGIHGTLHLTGSPCEKKYFPDRTEAGVMKELNS